MSQRPSSNYADLFCMVLVTGNSTSYSIREVLVTILYIIGDSNKNIVLPILLFRTNYLVKLKTLFSVTRSGISKLVQGGRITRAVALGENFWKLITSMRT